VVLWLFLAWAMSQRRDVARFAFTAFFALISMIMLSALAQHGTAYAAADFAAGAAVWLVALATMVLIFARPSSTFYRQAAARRSLTRPGNQRRRLRPWRHRPPADDQPGSASGPGSPRAIASRTRASRRSHNSVRPG
jgi:hypothetical protein